MYADGGSGGKSIYIFWYSQAALSIMSFFLTVFQPLSIIKCTVMGHFILFFSKSSNNSLLQKEAGEKQYVHLINL